MEAESQFSDNYSHLPLIPECQLLFEAESWEDEMKNCTKNAGHKDFIPVKEFVSNIEHYGRIPESIWHQFYYMCMRTGRIVVKYTSEHRPDTYPGTNKPYPYSQWKQCEWPERYATGVLADMDIYPQKECPCSECFHSGNPKRNFWTCIIVTAAHAVFDDIEAANTVFELDFDDETRSEVKFVYGVDPSKVSVKHMLFSHYRDLRRNKYLSDNNAFLGVTHDVKVAEKLSRLPMISTSAVQNGLDIDAIVSHPHGGPKMVSFGNIRNALNVLTTARPSLNTSKPSAHDLYHSYIVESMTGDDDFPKGTVLVLSKPIVQHCVENDRLFWEFPYGTLVITPDEKQQSLIKPRFIPLDCLSKVDVWASVYNIPTCPGSSGAMRLFARRDCIALHAGSKGRVNMCKIADMRTLVLILMHFTCRLIPKNS